MTAGNENKGNQHDEGFIGTTQQAAEKLHIRKGFVTGHDFSRADCSPFSISALAAAAT
jgi:hypothetical protein